MMNELSILDRLFGDGCMNFATMGNGNYRMPEVDVMQSKDSYTFIMDLPGLSEKDIDLSIKENELTIASVKKAEDKKEKKADEDAWLLRERKSLSFKRTFSLPRDLDQESASAKFENGVLTITFAKKAAAEIKKITISAA